MDSHPRDDHDKLMDSHRKRELVNWVPYQERRSEGRLTYQDDGGTVVMLMEVAGQGWLKIKVTGEYNSHLNQVLWNQSAVMSATLKEE